MELNCQTWSVIHAILHEKSAFNFSTIKAIVGRAGIDLTALANVQSPSASKGNLLSTIDGLVREMDQPRLKRFLRIVTEEMIRLNPPIEVDLKEALGKHGWAFHQGNIVELAVLDITELPELPGDAHADLLKAAVRLRDGDLSGAVAAACAAVDSVTTNIYQNKNLGDPGKASFQEKVNLSLKANGVLLTTEQELVSLGWEPKDAKLLADNLRGSLNQAAYVMQDLRAKMGDVHGTKPILKPLVFDSIKWAELMVRFLK